MPQQSFELKGEEVVRQHVKEQVVPVLMDKPAGNNGINLILPPSLSGKIEIIRKTIKKTIPKLLLELTLILFIFKS